jgi:dTDP-4-amino-4,6-dideoxygalactose transaminase
VLRSIIPFTVPQLDLATCWNYLKAPRGRRRSWHVRELEKRFASYVGVKDAVTFASGRYALYLLAGYYGCRGKRVVFPAYTCIPAADAFRWAGAEPIFVDVNPATYNPAFNERLLRETNVGAICLTYLYGLVDDPAPFLSWARAGGIPVIEDAAIALGARIHGKMAGSIGSAAVFSLQSSKIISGWRGGVVTSDDSDLIRYLRSHRRLQESPSLVKVDLNVLVMAIRRITACPAIYGRSVYAVRQATLNPWVAGRLSGMLNQDPSEAVTGSSPELLPAHELRHFPEPQAALALDGLLRIEDVVQKRRRFAGYLADGIRGVERVRLPLSTQGLEHAYGRFPIRICGLDKDRAVRQFARLGVEVGTNYPYIIPDTAHFQNWNSSDRFPNAQALARETILLPMHTYLRTEDLDRIIEAVREVATGSGEG